MTAPESGHTFHNRLSHSLKVAQVGRRNAERLLAIADDGGISGAAKTLVESIAPEAVEASCLAHDLGHPPFGHIAEEVLHEEASEHLHDGFEGNAQSFRIVTRLSQRASGGGLNLTRQTLDGLLKYPWKHWPKDPQSKREHKWGYYDADREAFQFAREFAPPETPDDVPTRSIEAELMEWADDLTYAVHDVDDFFRAGLVPLDRLADETGDERKYFTELLEQARAADPQAFPDYSVGQLVEAAGVILSGEGPAGPYRHQTDSRREMRKFGSELITRYLSAFSIHDDPTNEAVVLRIDDDALREVAALKMLVWVYVVRRPGLAVVQHGQQRVIRDLFKFYFKASKVDGGDLRLFPPAAQERLREDGDEDKGHVRARVVVDLISGLTETSAIQLHHRLAGGWTAPTLDATAQMV